MTFLHLGQLIDTVVGDMEDLKWVCSKVVAFTSFRRINRSGAQQKQKGPPFERTEGDQ